MTAGARVTRASLHSVMSIMTMDPAMDSTPTQSILRESPAYLPTVSQSVVMRLMRSPVLAASMLLSGILSSFAAASRRILLLRVSEATART